MSLFQTLRKCLFPTLEEEQRTFIQNKIAEINQAVKDLDRHYTTYQDRHGFSAYWHSTFFEIKRIKIPRRDPLRSTIKEFLEKENLLEKIIDESNCAYIAKENQRCNLLFSDIDGKSLDWQQRVAVICDEDRNLVLAGAGSGKTLTIAAKVKYLCQEKGVCPKDILLIGFTKKSAEELSSRINERLGIDVNATTFHKLGLDIICSANGGHPEVKDDLYVFVRDYFENLLFNRPQDVKNLIEYFAYYLNIPADMSDFESLGAVYEYEKSMDLETIRSKYEQAKYVYDNEELRRAEKKTLKNERVKSLEEVTIANFLYLNGVRYEYEKPYPYKSDDPNYKAYRPDFYLPDYDIYLEHFGIDQDGNLPWLSKIEEQKYKESMVWKRAFHKENKTTLIETYSYYSSQGCLIEKLDQLLKNNGVKYKELDFADIFNTLYVKKSDKYFSEFIQLCCTFIILFKSTGYSQSDLDRLCIKNPKYKRPYYQARTALFVSIIKPMLNLYNQHLSENNAIDFSDMINKATDAVERGYKVQNYKWIIIDEYQDISVARYKLIKAILNQAGAKLLCVGDDWQSIYRFAGSDISLFTNFERYFGKAEIMRIEKTYRNSQQLIDETGKFVMQNPKQFKKHLKSDISLDYPIAFIGYDTSPFSALKYIVDKIIHDAGPQSSILILGRTNYDIEMLSESRLFNIFRNGCLQYKDSPKTPISFLSVHKAKGLEADNVVLINFQNSKFGFPNKIADDPLLEMVLTEGDDYKYAEERRLLYVALTRTRNRSYVLVDKNNPSEFMAEFHSSQSVYRHLESTEENKKIECPRCKTGHLMIRRNECSNTYFVGCSNYPQCTYVVNDTSVMNETRRCPHCGGFLVKRKGKYGIFLGCTNYPQCRYTDKYHN